MSVYVISITAFSARVIVKKKKDIQSVVLYNKDPLYLPPPPPRYVTPQFQNMHIFHRPFMLNMIWESCLVSCYVTFCIPTFPFFFFQSRWNHVIGGASASFSLGEKRGETQKEAGVYPSFHWRKGSPPGEGLSRTGRGCEELRIGKPENGAPGISAGSAARNRGLP